MKLIVSVALWGRKYARIFAEYSLASMLATDNLPRLARENEIVYHIMTTRKDGEWLRLHPVIDVLARHAQIDWDFLEDHGYSALALPRGPEGKKYSFLSLLQNLAIAKSLEHDALVFNYADFVWANGSLTKSVELLTDNVDAVLSFCLPVDATCGTRELDHYRKKTPSGAKLLDLPSRAGADLAVRCLHREARLRYWDSPSFTVTPTYLLWPAGDEGVLVRAYHQTVLALRVNAADPVYRNGIPGGSLDGYFTACLAERSQIRHVASSDQALVFSLYDTVVDTRQLGRRTSEDSLRECLRGTISQFQRKFALEPLEIRRGYDHPEQWAHVTQSSLQIVQQIHETTAFDPEEYERTHMDDIDLAKLAEYWRQASMMVTRAGLLYRYLLVGITRGRLVGFFKLLLGPARARALRLAVERLIYGSKRNVATTRRL